MKKLLLVLIPVFLYGENGDLAPDFSLEDFKGKEFTLSNELKETKAIILWFTNLCKGCTRKIPYHRR